MAASIAATSSSLPAEAHVSVNTVETAIHAARAFMKPASRMSPMAEFGSKTRTRTADGAVPCPD
jgi:hypothetical protein